MLFLEQVQLHFFPYQVHLLLFLNIFLFFREPVTPYSNSSENTSSSIILLNLSYISCCSSFKTISVFFPNFSLLSFALFSSSSSSSSQKLYSSNFTSSNYFLSIPFRISRETLAVENFSFKSLSSIVLFLLLFFIILFPKFSFNLSK